MSKHCNFNNIYVSHTPIHFIIDFLIKCNHDYAQILINNTIKTSLTIVTDVR